MGSLAVLPVAPAGEPWLMPQQADTDAEVIALWLHGRSEHTIRGYGSDVRRFQAFVRKPLSMVTLGDLQRFADALSLQGLQDASRARICAALKSALRFAHTVGYLRFDVGRALRLPKLKNTLAERILSEADVLRMIALETKPRDAILLRLLYAGGLRVSELCHLKARDLQSRENGGQVTVYGKGGKTRAVLLPASTWTLLTGLVVGADPDAPVFRSQKGHGRLDPSRVGRICRLAAQRAGIERKISPHWFRHSHASHALDRGCPIHVVQATLGHSSISTTGRYLHVRPGQGSGQWLAL